jgi:uncharacterized repeat protein (TIGR03803 family)
VKRRLLFPLVSLILFVATLCVNLTASTETILHSFSPEAHGVQPSCIISDGAGNFYVCAGGGTYGFGVIVKFSPNSQGSLTETVLYNFADTPDGAGPFALLLDGSGNLWGLTESGGTSKSGTFFELTPTAHGLWNESVVYSFANTTNGYLSGGIAEDKSGNFYGTTQSDGCCGSTNYGSIFQLTNSGGVWTQNVMHIFTNGADGGRPYGRLNLDQAGNVYGTAFQGGVGNNGLVFEFVPASGGTWTENVLYDFAGGSDGSGPQSEVIFDRSGNLYGTTIYGGGGCGTRGCGTVYELIPANGHWTDKILNAFVNQGGASAQDLIFDSAGNLYGSSYTGGPGFGYVFELSPSAGGSWTEDTLWTFKEKGDGGYPTDPILGPEGQLYGATYLGGNSNLDGSVFELQLNNGKWGLSVLYGFPPSDGGWPYASLIFDGSGNLYGTTSYGGLENLGAVFEVSPAGESWKESLIYSFAGIYNEQPVYPSSLAFDSAGHLYGAAGFNGSANVATGSVFELTRGTGVGWQEETLINFHGAFYSPAPSPVLDNSGHVFETAPEGGGGDGAVFELTRQPDGKYTETTIYSFAGYPNDGAHPGAALIMDAAGNLYGTTETGGGSSYCTSGGQPIGCGTVFELQPVAGGGWNEIVLYSFAGRPNDGAIPSAPLIFDSAGNLYGTTLSGGPQDRSCQINQGVSGCGIVFELLPAAGGLWNETILHEFTQSNGDGIEPQAGVIFDSLGNLYGTTTRGGAFTYGTVYELSPSSGGTWTETILHSFGSGTDGQTPYSGLIRDAAGNFYGTTLRGGDANFGTVFEVTP